MKIVLNLTIFLYSYKREDMLNQMYPATLFVSMCVVMPSTILNTKVDDDKDAININLKFNLDDLTKTKNEVIDDKFTGYFFVRIKLFVRIRFLNDVLTFTQQAPALNLIVTSCFTGWHIIRYVVSLLAHAHLL